MQEQTDSLRRVGLEAKMQRLFPEDKIDEPVPTPTPTPAPVGRAKPFPVTVDTSSSQQPIPSVAERPPTTDAICSYFNSSPYGCGYWLCIAGKESSMRPGADNNPPYIGLFQIDIDLHAGLISSLGYTTADMYTAGPNSHVAWILSHQGVYTVPWPVARWLC